MLGVSPYTYRVVDAKRLSSHFKRILKSDGRGTLNVRAFKRTRIVKNRSKLFLFRISFCNFSVMFSFCNVFFL